MNTRLVAMLRAGQLACVGLAVDDRDVRLLARILCRRFDIPTNEGVPVLALILTGKDE